MQCEHDDQTHYSVLYGVHDSHTEYLVKKDLNELKKYVKDWNRVAIVELPYSMEPHQIWKWVQNDPKVLSQLMDTEQYVQRITEIGRFVTENYTDTTQQ